MKDRDTAGAQGLLISVYFRCVEDISTMTYERQFVHMLNILNFLYLKVTCVLVFFT
jgi:hypothetical protein